LDPSFWLPIGNMKDVPRVRTVLQLLSYKGAVDLEAKLSEWETFYNFNRPHEAFKGKVANEELRERL